MAVRSGTASLRRANRSGSRKPHAPSVGAFVQPKLRELEPGSPDYIRREQLLKIMRDPRSSAENRQQAAIEALPLCYIQPDPIISMRVRGRIKITGTD